MSVSSAFPIGGAVGKLPMVLLFSLILQSAAYGVLGFLMSLIVVFISRSRGVGIVVFPALMVAVLLVAAKIEFLSFSQPRFVIIYLLSDIILNLAFLFGFAFFGAWLFNRRYRLKMQEVKKDVQ